MNVLGRRIERVLVKRLLADVLDVVPHPCGDHDGHITLDIRPGAVDPDLAFPFSTDNWGEITTYYYHYRSVLSL